MRVQVRCGVTPVVIALVALNASAGTAQTSWPPPATAGGATSVVSLDTVLEPIRASHDLPALAAAIVRDGAVVALGAVGVRALGSAPRVTAADLWHLGSCTKAMTATLIARLVERGMLDWTTTVASVFPELADSIPAAWHDVTIEQLLTHRSGLPEDRAPDPVIFPRMRAMSGPLAAQRREVVSLVLRREPASEPGSTMTYANHGYVVAAAMAERRAGAVWEELMHAEVFEPLGLRDVGYGPPGSLQALDQPLGHRGSQPLGGPFADNPPVLGPAGRVHASLESWARFVAAHLAGARGEPVLTTDGTPFLSAESWRRLHTPPAGGDYAAGWAVLERDWADGRVLVHNGSNTLWFAVVWIAPARDLAVLVATNAGSQDAAIAVDEAAGALVRYAEE